MVALPRRAHLGLGVRADGSNPPIVTSVAPDSTAALLGVEVGDRVVAIDDASIDGVQSLVGSVRGLRAGADSTFRIARDGNERVLAGRVQAMPVEHYDSGRVELDEVVLADRRLRAVYTLPQGPGPFRLVILLPGGAWTSIEHPFEPEHPLCRLLDAFMRAGYATLRVERSGIGDSEGPPCTETDFGHELEGFAAGLTAAEKRSSVVAGRTVLVGHSIGGMLAPLLANAAPGVEAVIGFGTSARRWHDTLLASTRRQAELNGLSGDALERHCARIATLQDLVLIQGLTPERALSDHAELGELPAAVLDWYRGSKAFGRTVRFHQQLQRIDLEAAWQELGRPALALVGEHDWIATFEDACHIVDCVGDERSGAFEVPGTDHHMKRRESRRASFEDPGGGRFSSAVAEMMLAWLGSS